MKKYNEYDEDEGRFLLFPNTDDEEYEEELLDMLDDYD